MSNSYVKKMYHREKRRFTKLVITQYQTLGRPVGPSKYATEFRRLREYSEELFIATGCQLASEIDAHVVKKAIQKIESEIEDNDVHFQQVKYIAELVLSALQKKRAKPFLGVKITCAFCGGEYSLIDDRHYRCNMCGYLGKADQHGFPVSLPASAKVKRLRMEFHEKVRKLYSLGYSQSDSYTLIAYKTGTPLPMVHAGLTTSTKQMLKMIEACNDIIFNTEPERAVYEETVCL